ncbi:MAG: TetR/AcrR family transcriptional regulator [Candidatus Binatus sp.]|uniref:TetR/AcrR family transcriptional regulator n=1 Tax=Candidatus Binatus sp. TaxID=2811406 RepID=UPI0027207CDF|nr:TetR/AcrR family transcriptional regulator [Candidatus Binatus sp.]MDO8430901.1 TetR/AcrR family transcriptional regulator [Candidatus Binatus sp.]
MDSTLIRQPPGLRARQKLERERRILKAAERLFVRKGYAETSIEDVAARAGLAVGTIYNYFPGKSELLLAIVRGETTSLVERSRSVLESPPDDPADAITALAEIFLRDFTRDNRRFWRELFAAALAEPSTVGRRVFESDLQLVSQLALLLDHLKAREMLASDIDSVAAATVLYGVCFTWLTAYLMNDEISADAVRKEIRRGCEIVIRGLLPAPASISKDVR